MMITINKKIASCCVLLCLGNTSWAMQVLDDQDLAQSTGQDGISVAINGNGTISFDDISLKDRDGFRTSTNLTSTTHNNAAALSYIPTAANTGISFYSGAARNTAITTPFKINIDADGNSGHPTMNAHIQFASNLSRIKLSQFTLALTNLDNNGNITSQRNLLRTGTNGINVDFKSGSTLGVNLQLGHQPQGAMFMFTGGSLEQVKADGLELISYSCPTSTTCSANSSLKLDLELNASNTTTGIRLAGMYINTASDGLVIGKSGSLDPFDLKLNNVTMGSTTATPDTNIFNGLKNGSIGNIGLSGVSITNFEAKVSGM